MFRHIMDAIIDEQNIGLLRRDIARHWDCRCTVSGPGMHQAAAMLVQRYRDSGAQADNIEYVATDEPRYLHGNSTGFEWVPEDASLEIVSPDAQAGVICRYADEPLCLVCHSAATPPEGIVAEVVVRDGPLGEGEVSEGEFVGKLLLTNQPPASVEAAARRGGAVGLVSDCVSPPWLANYPPMREPEDAPDLVMWTIFPGVKHETPFFGFNLSARQGRRLRKLIATATEPVRLRATVAAEGFEGVSDLVNAYLPGTDLAHEEIWVLAHLSEPGARDNASGCCLCVELARVLKTLIDDGKLPPLRRTLRFMHATEVSGFLPYIEANLDRLPQVVAGLCVDSAGQDFRICGGQAVLCQSPETNASFVDGLMETLIRAAVAQPIARFSQDNYETFPWHTMPFWGNDAFISDGFFEIPTPHLFTWPDRFYHSSQDTPDQMSDNCLGRFGAIDGSFLYLLATADAMQARWLAHLAAADWQRRIAQAAADRVTELLAHTADEFSAAAVASGLRHLGLQAADAVAQVLRFAPAEPGLAEELQAMGQELREFAEAAARRAIIGLGEDPDSVPAPPLPADPDADKVYRRLRWRVPALSGLSEAAQGDLQSLGADAVMLGRIWPWINSRRTVAEIWERLQHAGALPIATLTASLAILAQEGMVEG
jgi:hypothetical protein